MEKFANVLMIVWAVLAIVAFVASFWAPLVIKIIGIVFGVFNITLIGGWIITYFQDRKNKLSEE